MEERYNEKYANILSQLASIMSKKGEHFRAKAYKKAENAILSCSVNIYNVNHLKELSLQGVGKAIEDKLDEYMKKGTVRAIEENKLDPVNIFSDIYGVGPKKAQELVKLGITTMSQLEDKKMEVLNDIQRVGLRYYADINERIPRCEIDMYKELLGERGEIVGSYRRGAKESGDIDIIFNSKNVYKELIEDWKKRGIILEVLSSGESKTLLITRLSSSHLSRRVDFLYSPLEEYAFAMLYFTGSKVFNTQMRQYALNIGYTFNEHGIYKLTENGKKGEKIEKTFMLEKDIFDFLKLEYIEPINRKENQIIEKKTDLELELELELESDLVVIKSKLLENAHFEPDSSAKSNGSAQRCKKTLKIRKSYPGNNITKKGNLCLVKMDDYSKFFRKKGVVFLKSISEKDIKTWLDCLDSAYHNEGNSELTDVEYDIIREYYDSIFGKNVQKVGSEVLKKKVVLPYEMASMNKIKVDNEALGKWMNEFETNEYIISSKLDGVSALYVCKDGMKKMYTRGDGRIGQDISEMIPHLNGNTLFNNNCNCVVRGELIMKRSLFSSKYSDVYANGRNMVAGLINQKLSDISVISDVDFVAYEVIEPVELTPLQQLQFLSSNNKNVVNYVTINRSDLTTDLLSKRLLWTRENSEYEIDGLIVSSNDVYKRLPGNPDYAFAFKMVLTEQLCEARVVDVIWSASKDGYLKPRVQIEPVKLGGVVIEYATGFNGKFIKDNRIGVGSVIELVRSGDVIPHIQRVLIKSTEGKMPSEEIVYEWNESGVDIVVVNISSNLDVLSKNISGFFRGLKVEGLSEGNVSRLIKGGYDSVEKIIQATEAELVEKVCGFGQKMAKKVCDSIKDRIEGATLVEIMSASNVFGRGFSDKKMELIMREESDILISSKTIDEKIKCVEKIRGFSKKTAEVFVSRIEDFVEFMNRCGLNKKLIIDDKEKEEEKDVSHPLFNKNIVMTGIRDKKIIDYLRNIGANIVGNVSKNTTIIIAKDVNTDTGKAEEGRKLGIPVMSVEDFLQAYNI